MSFKIARRHILVGACLMMVLMVIVLALYLRQSSIEKQGIELVGKAVGVDFLNRVHSGRAYLYTDYPESTLRVRVECAPNVLNNAFGLPWQRVSSEKICQWRSHDWWDAEPLQQTDKFYSRNLENGSVVKTLVRIRKDCAVVFFERSSYTKNFPPEMILFMNRYPENRWELMPSQSEIYEIEWP